MSFLLKEDKLDVVVAGGPRVAPWPSVGVRSIISICGDVGLKVGAVGGDTMRLKGIVPLPQTGGVLFAEDSQNKIHRIQARAIVLMSAVPTLPDPFLGWRSRGLWPYSTAWRLFKESKLSWGDKVAILGTGNRALKFGSALLEYGVNEVLCIETVLDTYKEHEVIEDNESQKNIWGWEVERRRFEVLGGKIIWGIPQSLLQTDNFIWELNLINSLGKNQTIKINRLISAGPFGHSNGIREYPPGSFLFELEQTVGMHRAEDIAGWRLEEERARLLACRIVKALIVDLEKKKTWINKLSRRSKMRLWAFEQHNVRPFEINYDEKWVSKESLDRIKKFTGVPNATQKVRPVVSIECFEEVACKICEQVCPESAIDIQRPIKMKVKGKTHKSIKKAASRTRGVLLNESRCTACGLCVTTCPSSVPVIIHEKTDSSMSRLVFPWRGKHKWSEGELAILVNRRGDALGSGRVCALLPSESDNVSLVQVEVPSHLFWQARGIRYEEPGYVSSVDDVWDIEAQASKKIVVYINNEKRLVRKDILVSVMLFENGLSRPDDTLLCRDGSCGLCQLIIDGEKKHACQTKVREGMHIKLDMDKKMIDENALCSCQGISAEEISERIRQGKLKSVDSVRRATSVLDGKCHGQACKDAFRRLLSREGIDADDWIDWSFPCKDWVLTSGPRGF